jgi:RHS repeat-associated protein
MVGLYKGEVVAENHYYPFGLTLSTIEDQNVTKNPLKYQGIELEKHFGLETYETFYRGLDPQLGRFNSIDPKAELGYEESPFASMRNNPVSIVDPLGDWGNFYGLSGKYLGSDGKNDNKTYVAEEVSFKEVKNDKGKVTSTETVIRNARELPIGHDKFKDIVGTIYNEMTVGNKDWQEGAGIYSVLENRGSLKGKDVWTMAKSGGIYGWGHKDEAFESGADGDKLMAATKGTIMGISNSTDYSGGGYFWQGVDFHKHYDGMKAYENFYLTGFKFSSSSHDIWNLGNHSSGLKSYNYMRESTAAHGKTTFMRYTNEYLNSQKKTNVWP